MTNDYCFYVGSFCQALFFEQRSFFKIYPNVIFYNSLAEMFPVQE